MRNKILNNFYANDIVSLFMCMVFFCYVFLFFLVPDLSKLFLNLFLFLSLPLFFVKFKIFKSDPFFILLLLVIFIQLISWCSSVVFYPSFANDYPKIDRLSKLFVFLFVAYWFKGSEKNIFIALFSLVIGFVLAVFISHDLQSDVFRALKGVRVDYGFKNAQFTSMVSGVSILICVFMLFYVFSVVSKKRQMLILTLFLLLFCSFFIMITSQSRQVWLAMILVLVIFPLLLKKTYSEFPLNKIILLYIIFFLLTLFLSKLEPVEKRLNYTLQYESSLLFGALNHEAVESKGNGIRINSWLDSLEWIVKAPVLGGGPNAIGEVIQRSGRLNENVKKRIGHLHSFHFEVLVAYGILGGLVIYTMYFWFIRSLVLAHRESPELKMYTVLGICFLIFWIVINFFESFSSRSYGVYVHNIMFGCLYTFYFTQQRKKIEEAEICA